MNDMNMNDCPANLKKSIRAYVSGRPTGGFLRAVLENDLKMAVLKADAQNIRLLPEITAFVVDVVPTFIRGSKEAVTDHLVKCLDERKAARAERALELTALGTEKPES